MRVGLTGGMGCGKSTVLRQFAANGWRTVESDALVRHLLSEDAAVIAALGAKFGPPVVIAGTVDRTALAALVFSDADALHWLEELLHPRVREAWQRESLSAGNVVVEIPLLFEKNLENNFDLNVCVTASLPTQLERLKQRGVSRGQALARMARQLPLAEKERRSDYVISNNGTAEFTQRQVSSLLDVLKS